VGALLGVVSDSHDNRANVLRAAKILKELGVSRVIHLGDVVAPFTMRDLVDTLKPEWLALVYGNNDGEKMGLERVVAKAGGFASDQPLTVELGGKRILALHGFGQPEATVEIVEALAESKRWDAILYGHTHTPDLRYIRGVLVLNPGDLSGQLNEPSIAVVNIETLRARLIRLEQ
jgi:putative phosphoesterase